MSVKKITFKVPIKRAKGRIEPGTRHGSYPHKKRNKYTRKGKDQNKGGE